MTTLVITVDPEAPMRTLHHLKNVLGEGDLPVRLKIGDRTLHLGEEWRATGDLVPVLERYGAVSFAPE